MNESCWIELLELNSNTWNALTVGLNWIIGIMKKYLKRFNCGLKLNYWYYKEILEML